MAGGHMKYRHLSRSSAHRQALLRNLVTSLFEHESISTTWHKAKEAQRLAEKMVTLAKKNTDASRRRAWQIFYRPHELVPKLFGEIRQRYSDRPGGYTRVLRIEPLKEDQASSAILELVGGPKDMRFLMTARTIARERTETDTRDNSELRELTQKNYDKVTAYRPGAKAEMEELVQHFQGLKVVREPRQTLEEKRMLDDRKEELKKDRYYGLPSKELEEKVFGDRGYSWKPGRWLEREPKQRRVYPAEDHQKTMMKGSKLVTGRSIWDKRRLKQA